MTHDPYGQRPGLNDDFGVYGPKTQVQQYITKSKRALANLERTIQAQYELLNDATRIAVYKELIDDLKRQAGEARYNAAYGEANMNEFADRLEGQINYLVKHGWGEKYDVVGVPKVPTLEQKVEEAYIRGGAQEVLKLMAR